MEYYSVIKRGEVGMCATMWMNSENMPSGNHHGHVLCDPKAGPLPAPVPVPAWEKGTWHLVPFSKLLGN